LQDNRLCKRHHLWFWRRLGLLEGGGGRAMGEVGPGQSTSTGSPRSPREMAGRKARPADGLEGGVTSRGDATACTTRCCS
jgi:hypothetical protein